VLTDLSQSVEKYFNHPIIRVGGSSVTISAIVLNIFLVVLFVIVTARVKNWLLDALTKKSGSSHTNWRAAVTLAYYALLGIGLVAIVQSSGLDLSIFTVLTGAVGIGVGFGMQTIFSNFVSGIIILLEKPLRIGDRIEVGDVSGNVQNISVRATTIITNDNVSIIVPNSDFISKQVINWTSSGHRVRISVSVGVPYDTDPDLVERVLLEVAAKETGVLKTPEPKVRLVEFADNSLRFSLLVWTHEFADRMGALKSLLNFGILRGFREHNISLPYPHREIRILNDDSQKESLS
jgi:small-conductance mechanosensitive channel